MVIRKNFGSLVLQAEAGELTQAWSSRPRSLVALILLLDQYSRYLAKSTFNGDQGLDGLGRKPNFDLFPNIWSKNPEAHDIVESYCPW